MLFKLWPVSNMTPFQFWTAIVLIEYSVSRREDLNY